MLSKILVTIDPTDASYNALLQASALARSEKSQLLLLSVVPAYNGDLRMMGRSEVLDEMRLPYKNGLKRAENTAREFSIPSKAILDEGEPFDELLKQAEIENVDLMVIHRNDHHLSERISMGFAEGKVISQCSRDILVVPEKASLQLDRILVAYDKTESSKQALNRAIEFSNAYGSELTIASAFEVPLEGFS